MVCQSSVFKAISITEHSLNKKQMLRKANQSESWGLVAIKLKSLK